MKLLGFWRTVTAQRDTTGKVMDTQQRYYFVTYGRKGAALVLIGERQLAEQRRVYCNLCECLFVKVIEQGWFRE